MATKQEKDARIVCFFGGILVGMFIVALIAVMNSSKDASTYLNNPKYCIDTTMMVHHQDTTYKYQFIKK